MTGRSRAHCNATPGYDSVLLAVLLRVSYIDGRHHDVLAAVTASGLAPDGRCAEATAVSVVAGDEQQAAMAAFPGATAWDQPCASTRRSASGRTRNIGRRPRRRGERCAYACHGRDLRCRCLLRRQRFRCDSERCIGRTLLATGPAYGAFQDGHDPIEIVGVVPDTVTQYWRR